MRLEDMPRPWLLAAVIGVPMAALLQRAEQEDAEHADAALQRASRAGEGRVARNLARSDQGKVVWLAHCQ